MTTLLEIQNAIDHLQVEEKTILAAWLNSEVLPIPSPESDPAFAASLDRAESQIKNGSGIPIDQVRTLLTSWSGR
jgi:hypothetical protein